MEPTLSTKDCQELFNQTIKLVSLNCSACFA